jgi:hypothetical protein
MDTNVLVMPAVTQVSFLATIVVVVYGLFLMAQHHSSTLLLSRTAHRHTLQIMKHAKIWDSVVDIPSTNLSREKDVGANLSRGVGVGLGSTPLFWATRYVLMAHMSGKEGRAESIHWTWFKTRSSDLGLMYIAGERAEGVRNKEFLNSPASARSAFDTTRNAFALALRSYPFAQVFAKFDDDSYVYTRELIRKIGMDVNSTADVARYWGYPMVFESGFQFGSGGAGYVLNRRAAKILQECSVPGEFAAYEDASVGFCMFAAGIPLTDLVGLHPHHPYQMIRWDKYGHPSDRIHRREPLEGYMNPLSYHYMLPREMVMMHDDIHLHGFPLMRSNPSIPKRIHQFWEGGTDRKPMFWLQKCKEVHADWEYTLWDNEMIKRRFPSGDSVVGVLNYDGESGRPANDDFYARSTEKNEWSDIMRY